MILHAQEEYTNDAPMIDAHGVVTGVHALHVHACMGYEAGVHAWHVLTSEVHHRITEWTCTCHMCHARLAHHTLACSYRVANRRVQNSYETGLGRLWDKPRMRSGWVQDARKHQKMLKTPECVLIV